MNAAETWAKQLQQDDLPLQVSAAESLAGLAEAAQPAIVALVQYSGSPNEDLCNWCTSALESVGVPTAEQIEDLTLLVHSASDNVAFWAATMLGRAGALATSALPALEQRAGDASPEVQKRAAWALKQIQTA